jgi:hypothetical protein
MRKIGEKMNITIDKEFRNLIEPLTDDERSQLEANILDEGCRDPLVVWVEADDVILLDGHNRYKICTDNDIEFDTIEKHFSDRSEAIIWMIDNQFGRRNLNTAQKATLALRVEKEWAKMAKANQVARKGNQPGTSCQKSDKLSTPIDTKKELAKMAGVSHDTIAKVKAVHEKADEETKAKMLSKEISINKAYQTVKKPKAKAEPEDAPVEVVDEEETEIVGFAMSYAESAIETLERIPANDKDRTKAFLIVKDYIIKELSK